MRKLAALAAGLVALALPAAAAAGTTKDFTFKSDGSAVQPGAVLGTGAPGPFQDIPFTIAPNEENGTASVGITWSSPADDWDLYVYRKAANGDLIPVASSAQGNTTEEQAVIQAQGGPVKPADYVIRVQNYAATNPDFSGVTKFGPYTPPNLRPKAVLKVPATGVSNKAITFDGSGSTDADGRIVSYAFDLDGNGSMETDGGSTGVIKKRLNAGTRHVGLRVIDDKGARSFADATITVKKAVKKKKRR